MLTPLLYLLLSLFSPSLFINCYFNTGYSVSDLDSNSSSFTNDLQAWQLSNQVTPGVKGFNCAGTPLLGGYNVLGLAGVSTNGEFFQRFYTGLTSHNCIYFTFTVYSMGNLGTTDSFSVMFGATSIQSWSQSYVDWAPLQRICGLPYSNLPDIRVFGQVVHSDLFLDFKIRMNTGSSSTSESYGFRSFNLIFTTVTNLSAVSQDLCARAPVILTQKQCICLEGYYPLGTSESSCSACDPSCSSCFGPGPQQCYQCANNSTWSGTSCIQCDPSCKLCLGNDPTHCIACSAGNALFQNRYCQSASYCIPPLNLTQDSNDNMICNSPCNESEWIYWDLSCSDTCDAALIANEVETYLLLCQTPCSSGEYLYQDGTCRAQCESPFIPGTFKGILIAIFPCDKGLFLYPDGTCQPTCMASFVEEIITDCYLCTLAQTSQMRAVAKVQTSFTAIMDIIVQVIIAVLHDNPISLCLAILIDTLRFYSYIPINYPDNLQAIYDTVNELSTTFVIEPPASLTQNYSPQANLPYVFDKYNMPLLFLCHFWGLGMYYLVIILIQAFAFCVVKLTKGIPGLLRRLCLRTRGLLQWNYAINFFVYHSGVIIFHSALDFKTNDLSSISSIYSLTLASFINSVLCAILYMLIHVIVSTWFNSIRRRTQPATTPTEEKLREWRSYTIIFEAVKDRHKVSNIIYLLLYVIRIYTFYFTVSYLYKYPLLQTISTIFINTCMLFYLAFIKPLKEKIQWIENLFVEAMLFFINLFILILSAMDVAKYDDHSAKSAIGVIILVLDTALRIIGGTYFLIKYTVLLVLKIKESFDNAALTSKQSYMRGLNTSINALVDNTSPRRKAEGDFRPIQDNIHLHDHNNRDSSSIAFVVEDQHYYGNDDNKDYQDHHERHNQHDQHDNHNHRTSHNHHHPDHSGHYDHHQGHEHQVINESALSPLDDKGHSKRDLTFNGFEGDNQGAKNKTLVAVNAGYDGEHNIDLFKSDINFEDESNVRSPVIKSSPRMRIGKLHHSRAANSILESHRAYPKDLAPPMDYDSTIAEYNQKIADRRRVIQSKLRHGN